MKERRQLKAPAVAALLAVVIVVGCLLSAEPLQRSAAAIDSPRLRSVATSVTRPMLTLSDWLRVDRARRWVLTALGSESGGAAPPQEQAVFTPVPTTLAPTYMVASAATSTTSPAASSGNVASPSGATDVTVAPATTTTMGTKRLVTAAQPLRVLVVGDSLVLQVGHGVGRLAGQLPLETTIMSKPISGLARPDFYDWPAALKKAEADYHPDVTVMMFGNNDAQDVIVDGVRLQRSSPLWWDMYRGSVEQVLRIAADAGSRVVWVGMPIMRSAGFSESARLNNDVYSHACAAAGASFVDCYRLFADSQGRYAPYLPDAAGKTALMRNSDGIHFTEAGGDRVAGKIAEVLRQFYDLE